MTMLSECTCRNNYNGDFFECAPCKAKRLMRAMTRCELECEYAIVVGVRGKLLELRGVVEESYADLSERAQEGPKGAKLRDEIDKYDEACDAMNEAIAALYNLTAKD